MSFKICLVGCGSHSRRVHGASLQRYAREDPEVCLAGVCDLHLEAARAYARDFGFQRAYNDIDAMLAQERPDAVSVVLPPELTCRVCIPLVEKGLPVFMEKPPSMTSTEFGKLMAAAERGHAVTQVAFNRRYTELLVRARELLDKNMPPESVCEIDYEMTRFNRRDADFSTTAIHALDAMLFLARSPYREARFSFREREDLGPGVADIFMEGTFESGARLRLNVQPVAGVILERVTVNALGQSLMLELPMWKAQSVGNLRYWRGDQLEVELRSGGLESEACLFEQSGFFAENKAFFDAVRAGKRPSPGVNEAWQQVALMEAMRNRVPHLRLSESQPVAVG